MLGLIRDITSSSSTSDAFVTLCCVLVHNNLEFSSVVWNSVSLILLKSEEFNVNLLIYATIHFSFTYDDILARLYLSMLHLRRCDLDALFLTNTSVNKITCPSILNTVGLQVSLKQTQLYTYCCLLC